MSYESYVLTFDFDVKPHLISSEEESATVAKEGEEMAVGLK